MDKKYVLITGVDGFLGGLITKRLLETTDLYVFGLTLSFDRANDMKERMGIADSDRIKFITNDDFFKVDELQNVYGAIHLAFSRRMCPASDIASSIDFAAAIYKKLYDLGVDRIINMSSQGVYGNISELRTETTVPAPETQYTMAKYASEVLFNTILSKAPHHTNLRLDPVAQSQNVLKGLCKSAKSGLIKLKGGKQVFSFIDGEDAASAAVAMLTSDGDWENVYNVGHNNKRYTLIELADIVADSAESCGYKRPEIELEESDISLWAGMDSTRFMNKTMWKPRIMLKESISCLMMSL